MISYKYLYGNVLNYKDKRYFQKKGAGETNILQQFYENRWIGFVDMAMCIFLNV